MNCYICNNSKNINFLDNYKLEIYEDNIYFKDAKIYKCEDCDFSFVSPMPKQHDLNFFYENVYRQINRPPFWITNDYKERKKNYLEDKILSYLFYITSFIDVKNINTIYDFGCGDGDLGFALKKKFHQLKLFCSEGDSQCKKILEERNYINFKDFNKIEKKFDLILTTHSLEHMSDLKIFSRFKEMLNPGGFIFFEVPNCTKEYFDVRIYDSPHLLFFTKKSIEIIAKKYNFELFNLNFSAYSFNQDRKAQKESQDLYYNLHSKPRWGLGGRISLSMIKDLAKRILPKSLIQLRRDFIKIKRNKEDSKMDWFASNTGENCYMRGILKK